MTKLEDERDIMRLLVEYAYAVDEKDYDALAGVFAANVSHDYGMCAGTSLAGLIGLLRSYLDRCGPTQHLLGSIEIQVQKDTAFSRAYVQARHHGRGIRRLLSFDANGEYIDKFVRTPDGWRITHRKARWHAHRGRALIFLAKKHRSN